MEVLTFSPYNIIIPGSVYGRRVQSENGHPSKEVVILSRYAEPELEEVFERISREIGDIGEHIEPENNFTGYHKSQIEHIRKFISLLPQGIRTRIEKEGAGLVDKIKDKPANQLLQISHGTLSIEELQSDESRREAYGKLAYHFLIDEKSADGFGIGIRLKKDGSLPERSKIETLLDCEVRRSNLLNVSLESSLEGYQKVKEIVEMAYANLDSPDKLKRVDDDSKLMLYNRMVGVLLNLNIMAHGPEIINSAIRGIEPILCMVLEKAPVSSIDYQALSKRISPN